MATSDLLTRKHVPVLLGVVVLVAAGVYAMYGGAPKVSLDERISGPTGYNPWDHWRTTSNGLAMTRWFPARVGQNCLPDPLANQDSGLATGANVGW